MGSSRKKRRPGNQHPPSRRDQKKPQQEQPARTVLFSRTGAWLAGVAAVVLATTLGAWLTDWGKSFTANSTSGPAIYATVNVDPLSSFSYVLASAVASTADKVTLLSGTASDADVMALIARHGGVPVGQLTVTVVLTGNRSSLRIVDIKPNMVAAKTVPDAAYLSFPSAGSVDVVPVTADLDRPFPVLDYGSRSYFDSHEIDLVRGERESFRMTFVAKTGYHQFTLAITYLYGSKQYEQIIPGPTDGLFQVTGASSDYHDYGTVYLGISSNQFQVASRSQACDMFRHSRGC
jgi:hypothetical protein